jgi:5-methylcytosine-specific restriction protein A
MRSPRITDPHGGRSLSEWIGATPDSVVPDWVRDRIFVRAKRRCHITNRRIRPGDAWQLEHIKPLSLGGENRESNLAPALTTPHKAKSAAETDIREKADRQRRKHDGTWPKPVGNARLQSRQFQKPVHQQEQR